MKGGFQNDEINPTIINAIYYFKTFPKTFRDTCSSVYKSCTFSVLNVCASLHNGPVLRAFNLSYMSGTHYGNWKIAFIVPIPRVSP